MKLFGKMKAKKKYFNFFWVNILHIWSPCKKRMEDIQKNVNKIVLISVCVCVYESKKNEKRKEKFKSAFHWPVRCVVVKTAI